MFQPFVHHNSEGANSNGGSFDSSPDEDDFNMDRNWEHGLVFTFYYTLPFFYKVLSLWYYFIDFQPLNRCFPWLRMISNWVSAVSVWTLISHIDI